MQEQTPMHFESTPGSSGNTDLIDRELVRWFIGRGSAWSGTASELLVHLKNESNVPYETFPPTPNLLWAHLVVHRPLLRSLGVDATLRQNWPRIVSLRRCSRVASEHANTPMGEQSSDQIRKSSADLESHTTSLEDQTAPSLAKLGNPPIGDVHAPPSHGESASDLASAIREMRQIAKRLHENISNGARQSSTPRADELNHDLNSELFDMQSDAQSGEPIGIAFVPENNPEPVFENARKALSSIVDLEQKVKFYRDPNSMLCFIAETAGRIAGASGVAICLTEDDHILYRGATGVLIDEMQSESGLLASCARSSATFQIDDAEKDPRVSEACSRKGIKSIIISPMTELKPFSGAIAFYFQGARSLQNADIIMMKIISEAVRVVLTRESPTNISIEETRQRRIC